MTTSLETAPPTIARPVGVMLPPRLKLQDNARYTAGSDTLQVTAPTRGQMVWSDSRTLALICDIISGAQMVSAAGPAAHAILEHLACSGVLADPDQANSWSACSGFNLIGIVLDEIETLQWKLLNKHPLLAGLSDGGLPLNCAKGWLLESYHYTRSARRHISPVLDHAIEQSEREVWKQFLNEEATHWRIYKKAFEFLDWNWAERDAVEPIDATARFIDTLRRSAATSPSSYAASLMFIEQAPTAATLEEDALFGGLIRHYGFPNSAIQPLWIHATLNRDLGHEIWGQCVLSRRPVFSADELSLIRSNIRDLIAVTGDMLTAVLDVYQSNRRSSRRFSSLRVMP